MALFLDLSPGIALQPGTNVLTVTIFDQAGNSGSDTLAVVYQTPKQNQTLTFPAIANGRFGDAPFPLSASASSGLPVSFAVVSGPGVVNGNIVTLTGAGTVVVRASQTGNARYAAAANVDQALVVLPPMNTLVAQGRLVDGSFQMAFYGVIGQQYRLLASTNLANWREVTNFVSTNSPVLLRDAAATNYSQRFYRAVSP